MKIKRVRIICAAASLLVAAATVTGCGGTSSTSTASATSGAPAAASKVHITPPSAIATAKKIVYCFSPTYPPIDTYASPGVYGGTDIQIAKALAESMGVQAQFVNQPFDGVIAALTGSRCDAIMESMIITPSRAKAINFVSYMGFAESLAVKPGNPDHITVAAKDPLAGLSGKTVSVEVASAEYSQLQAENSKLAAAGKPKISLEVFPSSVDAAAALVTGKVQAYFDDVPPIAYHIKTSPGSMQFLGQPFDHNVIGIGVRKSDVPLQTALAKGVAALYSQGTIPTVLRGAGLKSAILQASEAGVCHPNACS